MAILIRGHEHQRDWLLTTDQGQALLRALKATGLRPRCLCSPRKPEMYIAQRGQLVYMARMPGTASSHHADCRSHIVHDVAAPEVLTTTTLLRRLLEKAAIDSSMWTDARHKLLAAAKEINLDGHALYDNLLVPRFFKKEDKEEITAFYEQFLGKINESGLPRKWVLGILRVAEQSKYSIRLMVKHMPSSPFWVNTKNASWVPDVASLKSEEEIVVALLSCKPSSTNGSIVIDMAHVVADKNFNVLNKTIPAFVVNAGA